MNGAITIIVIIRIIFIVINIGSIENTNFLLFLVCSDISFDSARGSPNWLRLIRREKVGIININTPNESGLRYLAVVIFINILNIFVINPPIRSMNVDFNNLLFILKFMKNIKKYILFINYMVYLLGLVQLYVNRT